MLTITTKLESVSPYSQSKHYEVEKKAKELPKDYEARTWRERLHYDDKGMVFIPQMSFKNCISEAAKYLGIQVPGKGKANYTKHFEAGILVLESMPLGIHKDDVAGEWYFVPSDGKRGGGSRVMKCFPVIPSWSGEILWHILDPIITPDVFRQHLEEAGKFIGLGRFRPRNNGFYGRFSVKGMKCSEG